MDAYPRRPANKTFMNLGLKVSDLIGSDGQWNKERLEELFLEVDVGKISEIVSNTTVHDTWMWPYTKTGAYSVQSGYTFLEKFHDVGLMVNKEVNHLKQRIWKIRTVPKIKFFFWRATSGALAVKERLISRGIPVDPTCPLCLSRPETICHVLFDCMMAKQILDMASIPSPSGGFDAESVEKNIAFILDLMDNSNLDLALRNAIPWIFWSIWKNRNSIILVGKQCDLQGLVIRAKENAAEWLLINSSDNVEAQVCNSSRLDIEAKWQKPLLDIVKCNVSSSWLNVKSLYGVAWIARNHEGNALFHSRDAFVPSSCRLVAEFYCIIWALEAMRDLRMQRIEIASDNASVVEAILSPHLWPRYRTLIMRISSLRSGFESCQFLNVKESANGVARKISKSVIRDGRLHSYVALWRADLASSTSVRRSF